MDKQFNIVEYHADGFNNVTYNKDKSFSDIEAAIDWVTFNLIPAEWHKELEQDGDSQTAVLSYTLTKDDLEEQSGESITDEEFEKSEPVVHSWTITYLGDGDE